MTEELICPVKGCGRKLNSELLMRAHMNTIHPKWIKEDVPEEILEIEELPEQEQEQVLELEDLEHEDISILKEEICFENVPEKKEEKMKIKIPKIFTKDKDIDANEQTLVKRNEVPTYCTQKEDVFIHIKVVKGTGIKGRIMEQMDLDPDVEIVSTASGHLKNINVENVMDNAVTRLDFNPNIKEDKKEKYY